MEASFVRKVYFQKGQKGLNLLLHVILFFQENQNKLSSFSEEKSNCASSTTSVLKTLVMEACWFNCRLVGSCFFHLSPSQNSVKEEKYNSMNSHYKCTSILKSSIYKINILILLINTREKYLKYCIHFTSIWNHQPL